MTKYKPGEPITDPVIFLTKLLNREPFYLAGDYTSADVPMNWQVSTLVRYCRMPKGMIREAIPKS